MPLASGTICAGTSGISLSEVLRLIAILVQDAVILLAGFLAEFAYEHWLQSSHPFFQLAVSLSSALFLLLYSITVTVHIVQYVRGQFGTAPASVLGQYLPWALAAGGVIAAAVAVTLPLARETPPPAPPETRTDIVTPATDDPTSFALSPDGRQIVFVASGDGASRLWLRSLATTTAQPLAGTEGAAFPSGRPTAAPSASSPGRAEAARPRRRRAANPRAGRAPAHVAGRGTRTASSCLRRARRPP